MNVKLLSLSVMAGLLTACGGGQAPLPKTKALAPSIGGDGSEESVASIYQMCPPQRTLQPDPRNGRCRPEAPVEPHLQRNGMRA